ncbi:DUF2244 domain-containing protein [Primorskyibacter sp. S187A]|uniref:DUF2244 domain-containing protein n=1 Tax=Primorskyibacter sp. S187A TaxID=3415130 RepID=UPI003C7AA343
MPYNWTDDTPTRCELQLWPHQSLPPKGFAAFIGATICLIMIPMFPLLGSVVLWGILPFMLAAVGGIWWALQRNWRDHQILEVLDMTREDIRLIRHNPRKPDQSWECNAYWAEAHLHPSGGPVPHYLTLKGNGREVELGAFLSEEERQALYGDLRSRLATFKHP